MVVNGGRDWGWGCDVFCCTISLSAAPCRCGLIPTLTDPRPKSLFMSLPCDLLGSFVARGCLLAQGETTAPALTPFQTFLSNPIWLLCGVMMLLYLIVLVPEKRRKAEEAAKMSGIKKNDRIVTIGGIHGVVASVGDTDTIIIRLDESGATRMKIDRKAVARVLADPTEATETKVDSK